MKIISEIQNIIDEMEKTIAGKRDVILLILTTLLAEGHVLIEDVPGTGKTTVARALGKAAGLYSRRAQFTPDVMASDITGFTMWNKEKNEFEYKEGLLNCNIFLADEINRTPPKTQSALLEAMEERKISVDGKTYFLPHPFMVIATQNELGYIGTYPLPEAQLDRFLMKLSVGYPDFEQEVSIISNRRLTDPFKKIEAVSNTEAIQGYIKKVKEVTLDNAIAGYIVTIIRNTRVHPSIKLGCSPRAGILLMKAAQAAAFIQGRGFVIPEDVMKIVVPTLSHRIEMKPEARNLSPEQAILESAQAAQVPVPLGSRVRPY